MSELHKFLFEGEPVRGMLVRLTDSWREVLQRRAEAQDTFPAPVRELSARLWRAYADTREGALFFRMGKSSRVRSAVPRWFVPNCISKPSTVQRCGIAMTPALLISRSM